MSAEISLMPDWDFVFKKELKKSFDKTKSVFLNHLSYTATLSALKSIADEFYEVLKDSPIPVYKANPELNAQEIYYSTSIDLPWSCFMIPYFFYKAFKENVNFDLEEEFSQTLSWYELIGIINIKWLMERNKLTKTDVLICKVLSRYNSKNQAFKFPITLKIIANRTRQSISSIEKTFSTLFNRLIVNDFFLINPWKLGWELYLVSYNYSNDDKLSEFNSLTLSKEILLNNFVFRIIQIPFLHTNDDFNKIKKITNEISGTVHLINSTSFNWELSQLEPRQDKSFLHVPNFTQKPVVEIIPSVSFSYDPKSLDWLSETDEDKTKHSKKGSFLQTWEERHDSKSILKILNFIIQHGILLNTFEKTANDLDITELELSKLTQFLIKNEVISLAFRFILIGAGMEYAFLIEFKDGTKNNANELFDCINQVVLQCPFSYVYKCDSVIAGRVQVPDNWVYKFLEFLSTLQLRDEYIKVKLGQRILGYSFFTPNVKLPKDYVINEFGSYSRNK